MDRDPYARAGERHIEYLEEKEKRVRRPRREHELGLLLESALAHEEVKTKGALEEREMIEAAHGRRLGREHEFARPLRAAEIGERRARTGLRGAEAEKVRYGTEFEKGLEGTLKGIIGAKRRLGEAVAGERELGLSEAEREIRLRDEAEAEAEAARPLTIEEEIPTAPARPTERFPLRRAPKLHGATLPGLRYEDIAEWLRGGMGKTAHSWAHPGAR